MFYRIGALVCSAIIFIGTTWIRVEKIDHGYEDQDGNLIENIEGLSNKDGEVFNHRFTEYPEIDKKTILEWREEEKKIYILIDKPVNGVTKTLNDNARFKATVVPEETVRAKHPKKITDPPPLSGVTN